MRLSRRKAVLVAVCSLWVCVGDGAAWAHPEQVTVDESTLAARKESPERARGFRAFRADRYREAAAILERWLAVDPEDHDAAVLLGWARYRQGLFEGAADAFHEALATVPDSVDARLGLAYVSLQTAAPGEAAAAFDAILAENPGSKDALRGRAMIAARPGADATVARGAAAAAEALLASNPADDEAAWLKVTADGLLGKPGEMRRNPDTSFLGDPKYRARAGSDYLEVLGSGGRWSQIFIKGINLGAARPGRYPTEFPVDEETWRDWLGTIADLGANAVRAYTLLPPAFYRMLAERNAFSPEEDRLWLIQGVWTELPADHDFSDPRYNEVFRAEIRRVIDAVHGDLVLASRPGHASGVYDADVSPHVIAWIIGREWEPFAVSEHDSRNPGPCAWDGEFVSISGGTAMECWLAETLDFAAGYEVGRYGVGRPVSFASWPTLDPLRHPTESSRHEEDAWRRKLGLPTVGVSRGQAWDNDAVSVDATKMRATSSFPPGVFASYHVYPNYPDFLNHEPSYASARDAEGTSRYAGYLRELKAHHGNQPVLVAEFGMSTSRGVAHVQPQGWHHGGHDERQAMATNARLLRSIRDERMAGGVLFAFQDEWFKGTWSVAPFERPPERRRKWFNAESPEQSYGVLAQRPDAPVLLDGLPWEWPVSALLAEGREGRGWGGLRSLSATADEGYLYLLLRTEGEEGPPDWGRLSYRIGIDTYGADRGETVLPSSGGTTRVATGVEFLVELHGPDASEILVTPPYDPAAFKDGSPVFSPKQPEGKMIPLILETNRQRIARDGTIIPANDWPRGRLLFGTLDPSSSKFDTRSDVAVGATTGAIEIRIPWGLLNVADPSSHQVLHQIERGGTEMGTMETGGFRFYVFAADADDLDRVTSSLTTEERPTRWRWPGWEEPRFRTELKHGADELRVAFRSLRPLPPREDSP